MQIKAKNFTTTLSSSVLTWLDNTAKETNQQKNNIIEEALKLWKREFLQKKISESYKNATNDPEWVSFDNTDLKDWGEIKNIKTTRKNVR